jgi:hypothetical protein
VFHEGGGKPRRGHPQKLPERRRFFITISIMGLPEPFTQ